LSAMGYQCVGGANVTVSSANFVQNLPCNPLVPAAGPLQITTTVLPYGMVGNSYNQQLNASGGQPPYGWSLTPGSLPLPSGITLSTTAICLECRARLPSAQIIFRARDRCHGQHGGSTALADHLSDTDDGHERFAQRRPWRTLTPRNSGVRRR